MHWSLLVVIPLAHLVGGITAFGSSLFALALLVAINGSSIVPEAVTVLAICGLVQSSMIVAESDRKIDWRALRFIVGCMLIGMPVGYLLLTGMAEQTIRMLLGTLLIGAGIATFTLKHERSLPVPLRTAVLLVGGAVHGAFASGGTVLIPYLRLTQADKRSFRTTLAAVWVVSNTGLVAMYLVHDAGVLRNPLVPMAIFLGVILMTRIGQLIARRIDERPFGMAVSALMVAAGVVYVV